MDKQNIDHASFESLRSLLLNESNLAVGMKNDSRLTREIKPIILLLVYSGCTCQAISSLGEGRPFYNECVMLARAAIERLINFTYLCLSDKSETDLLYRYSQQRAIKQLDRKSSTQNYSVHLKSDSFEALSQINEIKAYLGEFTSEGGKDKPRWTKKNLDARLSVLDQDFPLAAQHFLLALSNVYVDASEALHGSLYGCTFEMSMWIPGKEHTPELEQERTLMNKSLLFLQLVNILDQSFRVLNSIVEVPDIVRMSKQNADEALEYALKVFDK